jgi:hypothetical protein
MVAIDHATFYRLVVRTGEKGVGERGEGGKPYKLAVSVLA